MRTLYIDRRSAQLPGELRVLSVSGLLRELILALSEEPVQYGKLDRGGLIAWMIVCEITRARELALQVPLPRDPRLQVLCAALLADPADRRTLEGWSHMAGASPRTLARLFADDLGLGFNQWRQRVRFHAALEALSRGEPIASLARLHGYRSASAFSAAFGRVMGCPPSKIARDGW